MKPSKPFSLNKADIESLGRGLGVAMAGAGLTYISAYSTNTDFGEYTPLVVAIASLLVNIVRKYIDGPIK